MTPYRRQLGLTAIELMATLLIIAVVSAIAIPSFAGMIRSDRARAQAGLLSDALNYARSEAVTRGVQVGISSSGGDENWNQGWRVFIDSNSDGSFSADDTELRVQAAFPGNATLKNASNFTVLFSSTGSLTGAPSLVGSEMVFQYRANNDDCSLGKDISINLVGRIHLDKQAGCP